MSAYYNEHDPFAAAWLRELIKAGLIADGEVDERSIADVQASDVRGFTQCHFFAGIGGWSYALRLAGWDDARPVWTGSCPCQPFSSAGKQVGGRDDRHLWPHWARLIRECRPVTVFGEQVESAIAHGWLDAVFDDLEREGYACGAASLPAASVGAFHLRQRVWFVADRADDGRREERPISGRLGAGDGAEGWSTRLESGGDAGDMGDTDDTGSQGRLGAVVSERAGQCVTWAASDVGGLADCDDSSTSRFGEHGWPLTSQEVGNVAGRGEDFSHWSDVEWIACRDGKARPTQPGTFPLAHGVSARVGRLRGYGNAIVPQVAAEVIAAYMAIRGEDAA